MADEYCRIVQNLPTKGMGSKKIVGTKFLRDKTEMGCT